MIHPREFETKLGFDQVRVLVRQYCLGPLGQRLVDELKVHNHLETLTPLLKQVQETVGLFDRGLDLPLKAYDDPGPWFEVAGTEGAWLEGETFLRMLSALVTIQALKKFLDDHEQTQPSLGVLIVNVSGGSRLTKNIQAAIDEEGKVRDNASPQLARIRRSLREEERKVRKIADQVMQLSLSQGWTPAGAQPTIRDGRLVIPVTAEHKRRIKGYIIDQSSTGQTVFVEPGELVEVNNDLRELELEEQKEVIRILKELTAVLKENLPDVIKDFVFLGAIDFIRAKAKFAREIGACLPLIESGPALNWIEARHPLLLLSLRGKRPVVPLNIELTAEDRFLLISGPNAGGKSVCLKTVGLIQYMLQTGLLVPVHPDSRMGLFQDIFLDLGDQQSIENDLSTYSSHLRNMDLFIRKSGIGSLVLLDELGSGTDPNFGGGIAQAVLLQLIKGKTWGLATTHYYNLKVFAGNVRGIRNAAMQFDVKNLTPLFILEIGHPGNSFALEIARKTGFSPETLEQAEQFIGKGLTGLETLMKQLSDEKQELERRGRLVRKSEEELGSMIRRYEELSGTLESQKKEILNRAKSEASALLNETNREIEKTIRHIRENKAEKKETRKVRGELNELRKKVKPSSSTPVVQAPLKAGDRVRIMGGGSTGTILSMKGKKATVQFGEVRSSISVDQLVRSDSQPAVSQPRTRGVELHERHSSFSGQLDIRGKRVEEVLPMLVRFMDDAILLGQHEVRILHGKGEGVLRKVVREYLGKQKSVASFHDEHADRGGDGLTIVEFR